MGNIKAMTWYSEKPTSTGLTDAPTTYIYQYDPKYNFVESTWGTGLNFANSPATFSATTANKEMVRDPVTQAPAYDDNGNILNLQRTNASGTLQDKFAYTYNANTNQLSSVVNTATGTSQTYATYGYDARGYVTAEATGDGSPQKYMVYDAKGKVTAVYQDAAHTQPLAGFAYDEVGRRIKKLSYNSAYQLSRITYYTDGVIYTQAVAGGTVTPQEYQIEDANQGRLGIYYAQGPIYAYELHDHLGNVRAVIAAGGSPYQVRMYTDYYPFGMVISSGGTNDDRYGYQGQYAEKDPETGWNAFELRMYNSRIGRWLQADPKGQFFSPYVAMGNDPVKNTDKDGGATGDGDPDGTDGGNGGNGGDCPDCPGKSAWQKFMDWLGGFFKYNAETHDPDTKEYHSMPLQDAAQQDLVSQKIVTDLSTYEQPIADNTRVTMGMSAESDGVTAELSYTGYILKPDDPSGYAQLKIDTKVADVQGRLYNDNHTEVDGKIKIWDIMPGQYPVTKQEADGNEIKLTLEVSADGMKAFLEVEFDPQKIADEYHQLKPTLDIINSSYNINISNFGTYPQRNAGYQNNLNFWLAR